MQEDLDDARNQLEASVTELSVMQEDLDTCNEALQVLDPMVKKGERHIVIVPRKEG